MSAPKMHVNAEILDDLLDKNLTKPQKAFFLKGLKFLEDAPIEQFNSLDDKDFSEYMKQIIEALDRAKNSAEWSSIVDGPTKTRIDEIYKKIIEINRLRIASASAERLASMRLGSGLAKR